MVFERCESVENSARESKSKKCSKSCSIPENQKICTKKFLSPTYIEECVNGVDRSKTAAVRANPKSVQKIVQFSKILVTSKNQV